MKKTTFLRIWGMPLLLAILILFGLVASLLGAGICKLLSWIALAIPLFLLLRYSCRRV